MNSTETAILNKYIIQYLYFMAENLTFQQAENMYGAFVM